MFTTQRASRGGVIVPPGRRGSWHVRVAAHPDETGVYAFSGVNFENADAGFYTLLVHAHRGVIMSDTPDEDAALAPLLERAHGHVVVAGLGLGLAVHRLLQLDDVARITVIEVEPAVISLVGPTYAHATKPVTIVCGDARSPSPVQPPADCCWLDIWDSDSLAGSGLTPREQLLSLWRAVHRSAWVGAWDSPQARRSRR